MHAGRSSSNQGMEVETVQSAFRAHDQSRLSLCLGTMSNLNVSSSHPPLLGAQAHSTGLSGCCRHVCPWPPVVGTTCSSELGSSPVWVCLCVSGKAVPLRPAGTLLLSMPGMQAPLVAWGEALVLKGVAGQREDMFWD